MGNYIPSHERCRKRQASALELENAQLRQRLSQTYAALVLADKRLREIATFEAWIRETTRQLDARIKVVTDKANLPSITAAIAAEAAFLQSENPTLYVADRKYSK